MITSPDPQTNYIFEALQNQRDNLLVENGSLTARVKELESQLALLTEFQAKQLQQPETPADESPAN